nr:uncharacterized protein LOC129160146 [Nothobranchius furzeri]
MLGDVPQAVAGVTESPLSSTHKKHYPCRAHGCQQSYTYLKSRDNHELKKHHIQMSLTELHEHTPSSNRDHKQEHTLARLSFGFFLMDMLDAVKEGDGERLMRLYRVALLYYKAYGHSHYAYSTFLLTLQVNASLTPQMAHRVTWNRFWSTRGGKGCNIPLDLHLEHLNNFLKSFLKGLGPNLSEEAARRVSQCIGVFRGMMDKVDEELGVKSPTGTHRAAQQETDVLTLVEVFKEEQLFKVIHGRRFQAFPGFDQNLLRIKHKDLWQWMNGKLKEWRNRKI